MSRTSAWSPRTAAVAAIVAAVGLVVAVLLLSGGGSSASAQDDGDALRATQRACAEALPDRPMLDLTGLTDTTESRIERLAGDARRTAAALTESVPADAPADLRVLPGDMRSVAAKAAAYVRVAEGPYPPPAEPWQRDELLQLKQSLQQLASDAWRADARGCAVHALLD